MERAFVIENRLSEALNIEPLEKKNQEVAGVLDLTLLAPLCQYTIAQANFSLKDRLAEYLRDTTANVRFSASLPLPTSHTPLLESSSVLLEAQQRDSSRVPCSRSLSEGHEL